MSPVIVRTVGPGDATALASLCAALWPDSSHAEHLSALTSREPRPLPLSYLVAEDRGSLVGFVEISIRPYVDGCNTAHGVGFLEGWYVEPGYRRQGIGAMLVRAAEDWARGHGCVEFASDALLENELSHRAHEALGFEEVERAVRFRKRL